MSIESTLQLLRDDADFMRNVTDWQRAPAQAARTAPFPSALHAGMVEALAKRGIEHLYTHQAEAIEASLRDENVVVVAGTAGGKSLCFQAPILNELLINPNARALCLFPTKALAQDQLAAFSNQRLAISNPLVANSQALIATSRRRHPPGQTRRDSQRGAGAD
ncbi:MAG: DEAD/DEAH box helicase [Anaerolineae bacterium]|nr:DEAD/DEAH box helicase [Anaerolineae bacterium]